MRLSLSITCWAYVDVCTVEKGRELLLLTFYSCAATPPPAPLPVLRPAPLIDFDEGANLEVFWLQGVLEHAGCDPGPQDGIMEPRTRRVLSRFQRDQGLPKIGRIGTATKAALQRVSPLLPSYLESEPSAEPSLGFGLLREYPVY